MKQKNVRLASGLVLLLVTTLTSCGSQLTLKRVSYEKQVDKCVDLIDTFKQIRSEQYNVSANNEYFFQLFPTGTVKTDIKVSLTGGIEILRNDTPIKVIPNLDVNLFDTIEIAWNEEKDYIKVSDSNSYFYIAAETIDEQKHYYKYYPQTFLEIPLKIDITDLIVGPTPQIKSSEDPCLGYSFGNAVMAEISYHTGYFRLVDMLNSSGWIDYHGYGLGLSSFDTHFNAFTPGAWLTGEKSEDEEKSLNEVIDEITLEEFTHQYSKKENNTAVAVNLKLNQYDLSKIQLEQFSGTGKVSFDYFLAMENSFVRQHELLAHLDNVNMAYASSSKRNGFISKKVVIFNNINSDIQISQDVLKDQCQVDDFDKTQYHEFEF
ncbi:MAG: hypothetical protein MJ208_03760 [Bacilli bacterium]|nr:hypothetical protein [Bacilli bacterium]